MFISVYITALNCINTQSYFYHLIVFGNCSSVSAGDSKCLSFPTTAWSLLRFADSSPSSNFFDFRIFRFFFLLYQKNRLPVHSKSRVILGATATPPSSIGSSEGKDWTQVYCQSNQFQPYELVGSPLNFTRGVDRIRCDGWLGCTVELEILLRLGY